MDNEKTSSSSSSRAGDLLVYGMQKAAPVKDGYPVDEISKIILKHSGNSDFLKIQQNKDKKTEMRIEGMKKNFSLNRTLSEMQRLAIEQKVEKTRSSRLDRSEIVVVDMDSFFYSCELTKFHGGEKEDLNNEPVAVVGGKIVLTSNYEARRYGVRSAMAVFIAEALVKELSKGTKSLVMLKNDHEHYGRVSRKARSVLEEWDPQLVSYSIDEFYMNLSPYLRARNSGHSHEDVKSIVSGPRAGAEADAEAAVGEASERRPPLDIQEVVAEMRGKVLAATGCSCSAGIAPNKVLAKICSDMKKPNGQFYLRPGDSSIMNFLRELPTNKMGGIGRVKMKELRAFGINTLGDLYNRRADVFVLWPPVTANFLLSASMGCLGEEGVGSSRDEGQKGISQDRSFNRTKDVSSIREMFRCIVEGLSERMAQKNLKGRTITLKVRLANYVVYSRAKSWSTYTRDGSVLTKIGAQLLQKIEEEVKSRSGVWELNLLGMRVSNIETKSSDENNKRIESYFDAKKGEKLAGDDGSNENGQGDADILEDEEAILSMMSSSSGDSEAHNDLKVAMQLQRQYDEELESQAKRSLDDAELARKLQKEEESRLYIEQRLTARKRKVAAGQKALCHYFNKK